MLKIMTVEMMMKIGDKNIRRKFMICWGYLLQKFFFTTFDIIARKLKDGCRVWSVFLGKSGGYSRAIWNASRREI